MDKLLTEIIELIENTANKWDEYILTDKKPQGMITRTELAKIILFNVIKVVEGTGLTDGKILKAKFSKTKWEDSFSELIADDFIDDSDRKPVQAQLSEVQNRPEMSKPFTNNIGCISKKQIEEFAGMVLRECGYDYTMKWTTAGDILIGNIIYIDKSHINEYPYMAKERVLHEVAHIDTWPQDDRHGELFHSRLAVLIEQFIGMTARCMPTPRGGVRWIEKML